MHRSEPGPVLDLEELVEIASELLEAVLQLEAGVGGEVHRQRILRRVTPLDTARGQPFRLDLGPDVTLFANQAENVPTSSGKPRPKHPDLAIGSRPNDAALVAAARWAVAQIISATTQGHVRAEITDGKVRAAETDAYGAALLRIAERLTEGQPGAVALRRRRACAWCGNEIAYQRSTKRYCSNACQQAMGRARRRAREEMS
jgi:predicted nucleic acid-binding Zn ribbon protein